MLDTSQKTIRRELVIAGKKSGKPVTITPQAEPKYHELVKLARKGNYWANLCVNGIHSLVNGRLHQNNIFVKPGPKHRDGREEFVMILPGCKVTVEKQPKDTFKVLHMDPDLRYFELQKDGKAPGLFSVKTGNRGWTATPADSNGVQIEKDRLVVVTDANQSDYSKAAAKSGEHLTQVPFSGGGMRVKANGFDMHFTPGESQLAGLLNFKQAAKPLTNERCHESALLLAKTMYDARDIQGVGWVSQFGGSAILTQAMNILARQKVKLKKHTIFLLEPKSSPRAAYEEAKEIGLQIDRDFSKAGFFNYMGNRDQLELIGARVKNEKSYKITQAGVDLIAQGKNMQGLGATVAGIAGLAGASLAAPAAAIPFLTALGAVAAKGATTLAVAKLGQTIAKEAAPAHYAKIKNRWM